MTTVSVAKFAAILTIVPACLSGCSSKAEAAKERYEIASRSGSFGDKCRIARETAAAYLEEKNEAEYQHWNINASTDCMDAAKYGGDMGAQLRAKAEADVDAAADAAFSAASNTTGTAR